jgi:hypothetical protein
MDWKERLGSTLTSAQLENVLMDFFRKRFKEVGAQEAAIVYDKSWQEGDEQTPFYSLCLEAAEKVKEMYEFRPLYLKLYGSGQTETPGELLWGLTIELNSCSLRVWLRRGTSTVVVSYEWPEPYSYVDARGGGCGGSHSAKSHTFDLSQPTSVDEIIGLVGQRCGDMLSTTALYD